MIIKKVSIFCFLLCFMNTANTQCTEEQNTQNATAYGGGHVGQSFTADCSGNVSIITMQAHPGTVTGSTVRLDIKNANCDTVWTVPSTTLTSGSMVVFDISTGSGTSRYVKLDSIYSFHVSTLSGSAIFRANSLGPIIDGCYMLASCTCISSADLMFTVDIEAAILPVELTTFTATPNRGDVLLNWETASETNNLGFEVQHSADGRQWKKIGFAAGQGTANQPTDYRFKDENPLIGEQNYYRLQQQDVDGTFEYSLVRTARLIDPGKRPTLYPSPAGPVIYLNGLSQPTEISVVDQSGQELIRTFTEGRIDIEALSSGVYYLSILGKSRGVRRFVKW